MTIQYIMLVSLGFLIASLITLLLAPIFWHRAVRLTGTRLRQSLPLSEQEISADKDQLRAKYAIRVHQLEKQIEHATLGGARQKIDLNRRDASITHLETDINRLTSELEENQNARHVLEQTVADRLPKIEAKLDEARKLLIVRDREVAELSQSSRRQQEALNEARVINQKQAGDIERLRSQVLAYEAQGRKGTADGDIDGALAIRTELEMLRARAQDQASLIDRLNAEVAVGRSDLAAGAGEAKLAEVGSKGDSGKATASPATDAEVAGLRREIAVLQMQIEQQKAASKAADVNSQGATGAESAADREVRTLKAQAEDQAAEVTRLRTELAAVSVEQGASENDSPSLRENRIALKARVSGLEAKSNQQAETIQRLRAELAQANQRSARQAASFVEEMRRLGIAAHITQPRPGRPARENGRGRNVLQRTQSVLDEARTASQAAGHGSGSTGQAAGKAPALVSASVTPLASATPLGRRLTGARQEAEAEAGRSENGAGVSASGAGGDNPPTRVSTLVAALRGDQSGADRPADSAAEPSNAAADTASGSGEHEPAIGQRPRLLDRITAAEGKG